MRWTIGAATLAMLAGCAGPGDPEYADPNLIGPPPAVGDNCDPPFPMNFAQDWFVFADLDQGVARNVFVEQDECAIGIYHDATDASANPREWQGFVGADPAVENDYEPSITLVVKRSGGGRLSREPVCCRGGLYPRAVDFSPTYAMLACHSSSCEERFDTEHTGLYLELVDGVDPNTKKEAEVTLRQGASASDAVFAAGSVWVLVESSVYRIDPNGNTAVDTMVSVPGARFIAAAPGGAAVFVAGNELVRVETNDNAVQYRTTLPSAPDAMAVTSEGVLVAVTEGATSALIVYEAATLTPRDVPRTQAERITSLAALDTTTAIAAATAEGSSSLFSVTATMTMALLTDLSRADGLSLGSIVPTRLVQIERQTLGFLGACYMGAARERHCYFEYDAAATNETAVRRVGVPEVEQLSDLAYDLATDRVVLSSSAGRVAFIDRGPVMRPRVQSTVRLPSLRLGAIAISDMRRAYVLHADDGAVSVIAEPD